jgi:CBS-domain-containing membrane protein
VTSFTGTWARLDAKRDDWTPAFERHLPLIPRRVVAYARHSYDRMMKLLDEKFRRSPGRFLAQSFLAFAAVAIITVFFGSVTNGVIVAALGASAFIVFATSEHETARPRRLIGGHAICVCIGLLCSIPLRLTLVPQTTSVLGLLAAAAVGLAVFAMTATNTEHPPAAGNALAFAVSARGLNSVLFIAVAVVSLGILHRLLRRWLRDLT